MDTINHSIQPERKTQYLLWTTEQTIQQLKENIFDHYGVREEHLHIAYKLIARELQQLWIEIQHSDLSNVVEEQEDEEADHLETSIADGDTIYLHDNLGDHGWIATRLYDAMHLWSGHMIQRAATEESWLQFWGDEAYKIGSVFHQWASEEVLSNVRLYEKEAGELWLFMLAKVLNTWYDVDLISKQQADNILRMYNDYAANDLEYIMDYYRTGKSKNFFQERKFFPKPTINHLAIPAPDTLNIKKRSVIDIGVVRS